MEEKLEKAIQQAKNERSRLDNDISEMRTMLRIREAERSAINSFIDVLNDLTPKN